MEKLLGKIVVASLFIMTLLATNASGEDRRARQDRRHPSREQFHSQHWVLDSRYRHSHYYPRIGYSLTTLPTGHVTVRFRNQPYYFHAGVWFRRSGPGFVVIRPPIGVVVPILPPSFTAVWFSGVPYFYANEVYYVQAPGGYAVVAPPADVEYIEAPQAPPQQAGAPQGAGEPSSPGGNWYYCESAKAYYPYVSECKEGWRTVPATPPQTR